MAQAGLGLPRGWDGRRWRNGYGRRLWKGWSWVLLGYTAGGSRGSLWRRLERVTVDRDGVVMVVMVVERAGGGGGKVQRGIGVCGGATV